MKRSMFASTCSPKTLGSLERRGYQRSFAPPPYFSGPRVNPATLGAGKPVPPGICCQATPDGGAICSTGQGFPPT